jgi:branched-chain amino acid transport system substrate-binding protein
VDVVIKNSDGNATQAVLDAEELITNDKVLSLVGLEYSGIAIPVGEVANNDHTPMISTTATHPNVTLGRPYAFRLAFTNSDQAKVIALLGMQVVNATSAAILFQEDLPYSADLASEIKNALELQGGSVVSFVSFNETNIQESNYKNQVEEIQYSNADVLIVPILYDQVPDVMNAVRQKSDIPVLGADGWEDLDAIEKCGSDCSNVFYTSLLTQFTSKDAKSFVKSYSKTFGIVPDNFAALAYDSMNLLKDALVRSGSSTCSTNILQGRKDLQVALKNTTNFVGIAGNITFDGNNSPINRCVDIFLITEVQSGSYAPSYYYSVCGN